MLSKYAFELRQHFSSNSTLQVPKEKKETKWEKFAAARGIKTKPKRDRMIWDESTGKWRPRWGLDRANNNEEQWILPAKAGEGATNHVRSNSPH